MSLVVKDGVSLQDVLDYLQTPEVANKYGLQVNPAKSSYTPGSTLLERGTDLLGSWVGGPADDTSPAVALILAAVKRLADRIHLLDPLSLHDRICILRSCFFPNLNYLLRTLPPNVGTFAVKLYDDLVFETICQYANDPHLSSFARLISSLPKRLGGLGLFNQVDLREIAVGTSIIHAAGVQHIRKLPLSQHFLLQMQPVIDKRLLARRPVCR